MKNLPYYKGGTCEKQEFDLSFSGHLKELEFIDFEDFCKRADEILYTYEKYKKEVNLIAYKKYIYSKRLDDEEKLDITMKEKCLEWVLSLDYDPLEKNVLYSILGMAKKGNKK